MKKGVILIVLIVVLLSMSSAYAVWNDSVTVDVSANSAIWRLDYVGRTSSSTNLTYEIQNGDAVNINNPYLYITETAAYLYDDTSYTATYTIKNNGSVPIVFEGVSVSNVQVYSLLEFFFPTLYTVLLDSLKVTYTVTNTNVNYSKTATVDDVLNNTGVTFKNNKKNVLQPGEECTLAVTYEREHVKKQDWKYYWFWADIQETDTLVYSVDK